MNTPTAACADRAANRSDLLLPVAFALWSPNYVAIKFALGEIQPLALPVIRFGVAGLILFLILYRREGRLGVEVADLPLLTLTGLLGITVSQVALVGGLVSTTAADTALLSASGPLFVMVFASLLGIERLRQRHWLSVVLGLVGVAMIMGAEPELSISPAGLRGDMLVLLYVAASSAPALIYPRLLRRNSVLRVLTYEVLIGTVLLLPTGLPSLITQDYGVVGLPAWGALLYAAVATGVIANLLYFNGVDQIGPSRATIFEYLKSIFGAVAGVVLLAESLSIVQFAGCTVVLASIALSRSATTVERDSLHHGSPA